jgi:hypothetical protein
MVARTPFTNLPDSSVEKFLTSSTASSRITATGVSDQLGYRDPQDREIDHRHPGKLPIDRGRFDQGVDTREVRLDGLDERSCERNRARRELGEHDARRD